MKIINKILAATIMAHLVSGCSAKAPDELPSHRFAKYEIHESLKDDSKKERISQFDFGDQNYIQFITLKPKFKKKQITFWDTIRYHNTNNFRKKFYEDGMVKTNTFDSHATVIIYGNVDSLDKEKFYDASGNLWLPKIFGGISFLSGLEKKVETEKGILEHIGTIDFGIVGQLRLENKFNKQAIYDATDVWYNNTTMLVVQKTIDSAKQHDATKAYLELSGTAPDGIRLNGTFYGGLFFSHGEIKNQSDYFIKAMAELYR